MIPSVTCISQLRDKLKPITFQRKQLVKIPISNDIAQLRAPQKGEPLCAEGRNCKGLLLRGHACILKAWVPPPNPLFTVSDEHKTQLPCLLCIRSIVFCLVTSLDAKTKICSESRHNVEWPFEHEGYIPRALMTPGNDPDNYVGLRSSIVKPCLRALTMRRHISGLVYVDQSALIQPSFQPKDYWIAVTK